MKEKEKPTVTVLQAKILYLIANHNKTEFGVGVFETDLESFQVVADAIDDLIDRDLIEAGNWHHETRSGGRKRDKIIRCRITEDGYDELDKITGEFLNSEGEFDLEKLK